MATVAWTATGDTSFSFTARRWSPWLPTSARPFLPVRSGISVSPAKAALSRPWIEGRLSKNDCAYASAASPITRSTARAPPRPRRRAVRRIFWPIGDHAAWIRARGLCPAFVLIRSGTFRAMVGGAQDSTLSSTSQRRAKDEGYGAVRIFVLLGDLTPWPARGGGHTPGRLGPSALGACLENELERQADPGFQAPIRRRRGGPPRPGRRRWRC